MRRLVSVAVATVLVLSLAGTAFAAKGGNKGGGGAGTGGSSAGIVVPDGVFAGTTTTVISTGSSWAHATCSQSGMTVYEQYVATTAGQATFTLGPTPLWSGGAASCTAEAGNWSINGRWVVAASTTFSVSG